MRDKKVKKFLLKALKKVGIAILVITLLTVILAFGTYVYNAVYQVKLVSDTSYGSLWEISFTLKEF